MPGLVRIVREQPCRAIITATVQEAQFHGRRWQVATKPRFGDWHPTRGRRTDDLVAAAEQAWERDEPLVVPRGSHRGRVRFAIAETRDCLTVLQVMTIVACRRTLPAEAAERVWRSALIRRLQPALSTENRRDVEVVRWYVTTRLHG